MLSETAFLSAIQEHEKIIWKVITMYHNNPGHREDLRQEILLNAWKGAKKFRGDSKFSTWLYQVAINTAITFYKKDLRHNTLHILGKETDPVAQESEQEQLHVLNAAIDALSRIDKALVMLFLEEYNYAEIGEIMGITANNVAVKMNRIKSRLKDNAKQVLNN